MEVEKNKSPIERIHSAVDALEPIIRDDEYLNVTFMSMRGLGGLKVQVYKGIPELALAHNAEITVKTFDSDEWPFKLSIIIGDVTFFQLASAEEMEAARTATKVADDENA